MCFNRMTIFQVVPYIQLFMWESGKSQNVSTSLTLNLPVDSEFVVPLNQDKRHQYLFSKLAYIRRVYIFAGCLQTHNQNESSNGYLVVATRRRSALNFAWP